jgi:hypothetical protein
MTIQLPMFPPPLAPVAPQASRRALLMGFAAAATPMAPALANALSESASAEVDPIFALIEAYDRSASQELALYRESSKLEEALSKEQKTWSVRFGGDGEGRWPPEACTDAPEWLNVQLAIGEASERISDQMLALLTTAPRTIEGVIALLERLNAAAFREEQHLDGADALIATMSDWYDERVAEAANEFHSTLAEALRNLAARGRA